MCECTAITWEHTLPKKNNAEGRGPRSYGLSQRNIGEDISFSFFFVYYILKTSRGASHMRAYHCPSVRTIGLELAWFHCLHPPLNMLQAPCPSGPTPLGSIHPIER